MYLYEIEYKYLDDLKTEWHFANVVVYDSFTDEGKNLQAKLDEANDKGDFSILNKALEPLDVVDDDVMFYYDINEVADEGAKWTNFPLDLQQSLDILIKSVDYITGA